MKILKKGDTYHYPWDKWIRKRRVILRRGRDYRAMSHSMGVIIRRMAAFRGYTVSIIFKEVDVLVVTFKRKKKVRRA